MSDETISLDISPAEKALIDAVHLDENCTVRVFVRDAYYRDAIMQVSRAEHIGLIEEAEKDGIYDSYKKAPEATYAAFAELLALIHQRRLERQ